MKTRRTYKIMTLWLTVALGLCLVVTSAVLAQEEKWIELYVRAGKLRQQGKLAEATKIAERALEVAKKTFGPDSADVAYALNDLALLYMRQGKYSEAKRLLKRSLAMREKTRRNIVVTHLALRQVGLLTSNEKGQEARLTLAC